MAKKTWVGVLAVALAIGLALGVGLATIGAISEPVSAGCCGTEPDRCGNQVCEPAYGENIQTCAVDCII